MNPKAENALENKNNKPNKPMKKLQSALLAALITGLAAVPAAKASLIISAVGVDSATKADWRTTNVTKPYTVGANTIYGTDGYVAMNTGKTAISTSFTNLENAATGTLASLPSWATFAAVNNGWSTFAGPGFDDPTLTPGPSVGNITSGLVYRSLTTGSTALFTLALGANTPADVRIGFIHNGVGLSPLTSMTLSGTGSSDTSASVGGANDDIIRYVFFDVQNGANQTLTLSYNVPGTDNYGFSGLTLDVVPEPSTWAMLLGGVGLLAIWRRRRA